VPELFQVYLATSGFALKFGSAWVDPLPVFVDRRGDFPPIQVRNGSASPVDDSTCLRVEIGDGTEAMVGGVGYVYRTGKWREMSVSGGTTAGSEGK
jgi:hypothetical protein